MVRKSEMRRQLNRGILNRQSRAERQNRTKYQNWRLNCRYFDRTWLQNVTPIGKKSLIPAEYDLYWQNMIILADFNFYWQNMTSTGRIWLPLAEHGLYWLIVTLAGRIWLILAEYDFHWQNMIYTGLLSLLQAEYAANQKCSAVLLCSADSIYPVTYFCNDLQHVNQKLLFLKHTRHFTPSAVSRCCHVVGSVTPGLRYQPLRANYISVFSAAEHMNMNVLLLTPTSALDIHAQVMNR